MHNAPCSGLVSGIRSIPAEGEATCQLAGLDVVREKVAIACKCAPRPAARLDTGRVGCGVCEGSAIAQLPTQNGPERSTFLECALRLIAQGLDKIRQRGSTRRLD